MNFAIDFTRTVDGVTSTVTAFSSCGTAGGAILDAQLQARRADAACGESATYGDFVARRIAASAKRAAELAAFNREQLVGRARTTRRLVPNGRGALVTRRLTVAERTAALAEEVDG